MTPERLALERGIVGAILNNPLQALPRAHSAGLVSKHFLDADCRAAFAAVRHMTVRGPMEGLHNAGILMQFRQELGDPDADNARLAVMTQQAAEVGDVESNAHKLMEQFDRAKEAPDGSTEVEAARHNTSDPDGAASQAEANVT